eukprot:1718444-Pyramimonas_sp.AAC.1
MCILSPTEAPRGRRPKDNTADTLSPAIRVGAMHDTLEPHNATAVGPMRCIVEISAPALCKILSRRALDDAFESRVF